VIKIIVFLCSFFGFVVAKTSAQEPVEPVGVVRLRSSLHPNCGSGVIIDQYNLITAAHVAKSLCNGNSCNQIALGIADADSTVSDHQIVNLKIKLLFKGYDLAILHSDEPLFLNIALPTNNPTELTTDTEVTAASYPMCGNYTLSKGKIITSNSFNIDSSATGYYGSSGGGLFLNDGTLVGIISQSRTMFGAIKGFISSSFDLRSRRIWWDIINAPDPKTSLIKYSEILLTHYTDNIAPLTGTRRLFESMEFEEHLKGIELFLSLYITQLEVVAPLLLRDLYPDVVMDYLLNLNVADNTDSLPPIIKALTLASSLETYGVRSSLFKKLKSDYYFEKLNQKNWPDLARMLQRAGNGNYSGTNSYVITRGTILVLFGLSLFFVYAFTIGITYILSSTSIKQKLKNCFLVALPPPIWPFSFFIFLLRRNK
jgi:hypothetical protein